MHVMQYVYSKKLQEKGTSAKEAFDWKVLVRETCVRYNTPPFAAFFLGPFDSVHNEKVLNQRYPRQKTARRGTGGMIRR